MMGTWVLIIYIYAGVLAKGDSVAIDHISGFSSKENCMAQGQLAKDLVGNTTKDYRYVCINAK